MERPRPSEQLINKLWGNDIGLLRRFHLGLSTLPLRHFYPSLDFLETVAFATAAPEIAEKGEFSRSPRTLTLYEIFRQTYAAEMLKEKGKRHFNYTNVFQWLGTHKRIPLTWEQKFTELNPFQGRGLERRLTQVTSTTSNELKSTLTTIANNPQQLQKPIQTPKPTQRTIQGPKAKSNREFAAINEKYDCISEILRELSAYSPYYTPPSNPHQRSRSTESDQLKLALFG